MSKQNNKKRKFTFNIIDALIILLLVALIALIVYVFILGKDFKDLNPNNQEKENTETVEIIEPSTLEQTYISNIYYRSDGNIVYNLL